MRAEEPGRARAVLREGMFLTGLIDHRSNKFDPTAM